MTQKEFEQRFGKEVSTEYFEKINDIYMEIRNMDKDEFCKIWKRVNSQGIEIVEGLMEALEFSHKHSASQSELIRDLRNEINDTAGFLVDQAEAYKSTDLRERAIQMMGEKEYIKMKLQKCYDLWDEDKEILINLL